MLQRWNRWRKFLSPILSEIYNFAYPPNCIGCQRPSYFDLPASHNNSRHQLTPLDRKILSRENWCQDCLDQIRCPLDQRCPTCGAIVKLHAALKGRCHLCQFSDFYFDQAVCINNYGGLMQEMIIKMKGQRCEITAIQLGELLGYEIERLDNIDSVDVMTCVPTHWRKKLHKGFQASEILCKSASRIGRIPAATKILTAVRPTQKQGMLSDFKRFENVKNAFIVSPFFKDRIKGKHILLIDDVMTSGATTSQCAKALRSNGASRVDVAVVARGAKSR